MVGMTLTWHEWFRLEREGVELGHRYRSSSSLFIFSRACLCLSFSSLRICLVQHRIVAEDVVKRSSLRRDEAAGNKNENGNGLEHEAVRRNGRRTDRGSVAKHRVAMNPSTRANDVVAGHYTSHLDSSLQHNLDFLDTPWALHKCMSLCITMHDV
jgi:hypothetical protein